MFYLILFYNYIRLLRNKINWLIVNWYYKPVIVQLVDTDVIVVYKEKYKTLPGSKKKK